MTERSIELIGRRLNISDKKLAAFQSAARLEAPAVDSGNLRQLTADAAEVVADVLHFAILELTHLKQFQADSRWIARVLGRSVDDVNVAIQRLLRLNLMEMKSRGVWVDRLEAAVGDLGSFARIVVEQLTHQTRQLSAAAVAEVPSKYRAFSTSTFAMSTDRLAHAVRLIEKLRSDISRLSADGERDDVYQLEIQFFPLTRLKNKGINHG